MIFGLGLAGAYSPRSVIEYDNTPEGLNRAQAEAQRQNMAWADSMLAVENVRQPIDHKRMTRRKWWLVRKAIPLPWVKP